MDGERVTVWPIDEEPVADQATVEGPAAGEPVADEAVAEGPVAGEPVLVPEPDAQPADVQPAVEEPGTLEEARPRAAASSGGAAVAARPRPPRSSGPRSRRTRRPGCGSTRSVASRSPPPRTAGPSDSRPEESVVEQHVDAPADEQAADDELDVHAELRSLRAQVRTLEETLETRLVDAPAGLAVVEPPAEHDAAYLRQVSLVVRGLAEHTDEQENPHRTLARVAAAVERLGAPNGMDRPVLPLPSDPPPHPRAGGPWKPTHRREIRELEAPAARGDVVSFPAPVDAPPVRAAARATARAAARAAAAGRGAAGVTLRPGGARCPVRPGGARSPARPGGACAAAPLCCAPGDAAADD